MSTHLSARIQFEQVVAAVLRMIKEHSLFERLRYFINPKHFYANDTSDDVEALKTILVLMKALAEEGNIEKFTYNYIESQIPIKITNQEKANKVQQIMAGWLRNDAVIGRINDQGCWDSFVDYIKALQIFEIGESFAHHIQKNEVNNAVDKMNDALGKIAKISSHDKETVEEKELIKIIEMDNSEQFKRRVLLLDNPLLDDIMGGFEQQTLNGFISVTNGGKCLGKDTPILMYDGTIKMVQDVVVGDLLMGDDSTSRTVLSLARGREQLYKIKPKKGDSYVVNESHILTLFDAKEGKLVDMELRSYLNMPEEDLHFKKSKRNRRLHKRYLSASVGVDFEGVLPEVNIDPYLLGVWLGDGNSRESWVTNVDDSVIRRLHSLAADMGDSIKILKGSEDAPTWVFHNDEGCEFKKRLKSFNLLLNKHIPMCYKTAKRDVRLRLLAGLIDSDGYKHRNGNYEITSKFPTLAEDILFLARSLGFAAFRKDSWKSCNGGPKKKYHRISIIGDGSTIPVEIDYKKSTPRKSYKRFLNYPISVEKLNVGDYYGFAVDGNKRFLLGDFQVTHNSMLAHHLVARAVQQRMPVWFGVLEDRKKSFVYRIMSRLSGISMRRLKKEFNQLTSTERATLQKAEEAFDKYVKVEFLYGCNIETVHKAALDYDLECKLRNKEVPIVNIVDYTGHISGRSSGDKMFEKMRAAYGSRKDFALKHDKICFDFAQINREGSKNMSNNHVITQNDLAGSFDLAQIFDNLISINRNDENVTSNTSRLHICKARDSAVGVTVKVKVDFSRAFYDMKNWELISGNAEVTEISKKLSKESKDDERGLRFDDGAGQDGSVESKEKVINISRGTPGSERN